MSRCFVLNNPNADLRSTVLTKFRDSNFSPFSPDEVKAITRQLERNPCDPLAHLYQSFVWWSEGKIDDASDGLVRCRDLVAESRDQLVGIEIGANSWMPEYLSVAELIHDPDDVPLHFLRESDHSSAILTILVCSDETYFQRFRSLILAAAVNVYHDFIIHLHLVNPSEDSVELLQSYDFPSLSVTIQRTDASQSFRSYYASSRFIIGKSIMNHYGTHLLTTDVDVFPSSLFEPTIREIISSGVDLSCGHLLRSWMPWNTYIVTKCFFRNNERGRAVLDDMSAYIRKVSTSVGSYEHLWWIDQNAMHIAVTRQTRVGMSFRPIASYGQLFVGPERIGKDAFAGLLSSFFPESNTYRPSNHNLSMLLGQYASALHRDEAILLTLIHHFLAASDAVACELMATFMLAFHLAGALTPNTLDAFIACLICSQKLPLVAACVMRRTQAVNHLLQPSRALSTSIDDSTIDMLVPHIARHKYFVSLEEMARNYSGNDVQTIKHFCAGVVRSHLHRGLIGQAKAELESRFRGGILVGGIQRSGTNYLAEMLRMHVSIFTTYTDDNNLVFWKHALPHETQKSRCNPKFSSPVAAIKELGLHFIVLYKEPYTWLDSIVNRFPADFFTSRPGFVKHERDFAGMMKFYALYLNRWRDESIQGEMRHITLINYEQLVADPVSTLRIIPGLDGVEEWRKPLDLAYSRGFAKRLTKPSKSSDVSVLPDEAVTEIAKVLKSQLSWMNCED